MAQKNILNQVKTADGYDTLYPLTPYQIHQAKTVTGNGSNYAITIDLPAENITVPIIVSFTPNVPNTESCTISVNGLASKPLYINNTVAVAGMIGTTDTCLVKYDINADSSTLIAFSGALVKANASISSINNSISTINNTLSNKLNISAKATTAQATAGVADDVYMTPLKTAQALSGSLKVKVINVDISETSTTYTINIDNYVFNNTVYVEVFGYIDSASDAPKWDVRGSSGSRNTASVTTIDASGNPTVVKSNTHDIDILLPDNIDINFRLYVDAKAGIARFQGARYDRADRETNPGTQYINFVQYYTGVYGSITFKTGTSTKTTDNFCQLRVYNIV